MKVLFVAPIEVGELGKTGGVFKEMLLRKQSLETQGTVVDFYNHWEETNLKDYDLAHLFVCSSSSTAIASRISKQIPLISSPIIDKQLPNVLIRALIHSEKFVPYHFSQLGRCASICRQSLSICARSEDEHSKIVRGIGISNVKVKISPVPIPHVSLHQSPTPSKDRSVLFLGDSGNPRKNVITLIKACSSLDVTLIIAGKQSLGKYADKVNALIKKYTNVTYIGVISEEEKIQRMNRCSIFALPSIIEGIGLAAAEAATLGKTILITKCGGTVDYFDNYAYYINPLSVKSTTVAIQSALEKPIDCSHHIVNHFSMKKCGKILNDIYTQICQ